VKNSKAEQAAATAKRPITDTSHAGRNADAGQVPATAKRLITDTSDAGRNNDAGQAAATAKRPSTDTSHAGRNNDTGQAFFFEERGIVYETLKGYIRKRITFMCVIMAISSLGMECRVKRAVLLGICVYELYLGWFVCVMWCI
jgi:hypothetical protein